ncbi:hypothetical protein RFI02_11320 [Acinetobacter sichuanensis]|uniref:hypothetical protein n=1 Tax=Acinetobacter sichuanensis TaxID=2136183 RepID=UPI00280E448C|nr:hypothetical protein [Acinetobacter sichuanensis]MDQ9021698.1 hypothetical protein [Acinetobacter sichuanensis]
MKLIRVATSEAVQIENGFFWSDEFDYKPIEQKQQFAVNGTLIIQEGKKKAGRSITLVPSNEGMGWIKRRELSKLQDWSALQDEQFTLEFDYPHDNRRFNVLFNHQEGAITNPKLILGFSPISDDEYYSATLKFLEL